METWFAVYICLSGLTCPKSDVISNEANYSQRSCETDARLIAQAMFVRSGDRYGYRCEKVEYEPPRVPK